MPLRSSHLCTFKIYSCDRDNDTKMNNASKDQASMTSLSNLPCSSPHPAPASNQENVSPW